MGIAAGTRGDWGLFVVPVAPVGPSCRPLAQHPPKMQSESTGCLYVHHNGFSVKRLGARGGGGDGLKETNKLKNMRR